MRRDSLAHGDADNGADGGTDQQANECADRDPEPRADGRTVDGGRPVHRRRLGPTTVAHSYGLYSYGLHSYGLYSYGLYRYGLRCIGVDCSGHGRCVNKRVGGCVCDAGRFRP